MKNQKLVIFGALILVVVLIGGFLVFSPKKENLNSSEITNPEQVEMSIPTMDPEEIGLSLTISEDERIVTLGLTKLEGLSAIDYELSYLSKGDIPRGVIGHIDIKSQKTINEPIRLGTCSDVCHYDEDVSDIKIILKITKKDKSTAQVEKSL